MNQTGEYRRKDGSAGYINSEEQDGPRAFCTDCRDEGRDLQQPQGIEILDDAGEWCEPTARECQAALRSLSWFGQGRYRYGLTIRELIRAGF